MEMYSTPQTLFRTAGTICGAVFVSASLLVQPAPVNAAGGDPAPCGGISTKSACVAATHCKWQNNTCVSKNGRSETDPIQQLYITGRLLAKSGEFEKAIAVLKTADQSDPHVLNYLGYSYRKSGDLKTAIGYYKTALAIDPNFVLAREYLGEGYVKAGRLDLAKLELEQIGKRCGKGCQEYVELAAVISGTDKATW